MEEHQLHAASTVTSTAHNFSSKQQEFEEDLDGSCGRSLCDMDLFLEYAIRTIMDFEEKAKDIKQSLLQFQMRRHDIKNQYSDHHPREKVAAKRSVLPSTVNEERPGQTHTHHKFRLCFKGSLKSTIYTNKPLPGQSNGGIEIVICEDDRIITSGRLASLSVEIVALEKDHSCRGEWTEEEFDRQIRKSRDGQGSVLDGECLVKLVDGKASLGNIRFKEGSTGTRSREFVLAARVCRSENIRIEEAFMLPPFVVLVERSKGNEKSSLPKLTDKVYTLKSIARNGPNAKRLEKENIHTVKDFLKALNKDRNKLRQILQIKMVPAWDAMVKHAMECDLSHKRELRSYKVESRNVSLFFNCVDDLVGAEFNDAFVATDMFDSAQKAFVDAQLEQAHSKLDDIQADYVLENNHPVKILTNIVSSGISHQPTLKASNLGPFDSGIDYATGPGHPFGDANLNTSGQGSPELSHPVLGNGHANQDPGQNGTPNPKEYTVCHADTMDKECTPNTMAWSGCSSEGTFPVAGMPSHFPRACGASNCSDYVVESINHPVPTLLCASSQNVSGNQVTFQEAENMRPLGPGIDRVHGLPFGDANRNVEGHSASEPFRPDYCEGHVNQGLGLNCITDPEGGVIQPDSTTTYVDHTDNMDETWDSLFEDYLQKQNNTKPDCSPEGTFAAQGTLIVCQQYSGSEAPNDAPFWPEQVADHELVNPDQTIYDATCSGYSPSDPSNIGR